MARMDIAQACVLRVVARSALVSSRGFLEIGEGA
jgi:hypothetical protein